MSDILIQETKKNRPEIIKCLDRNKYFNNKGIAKILIALAKGKKNHDKRETKKNRDWNREKAIVFRKTS